MLDAAIDKMETYREGTVWSPLTPELKAQYVAPLPRQGLGPEKVQAHLSALLPYRVGNTHPRSLAGSMARARPAT